ncbi:MAG: hypothetical protein QHH15_02160 [Candidatus Thermoplasmatota archaeon]|nr:hypothetical protein [Candidatus Thermoplasmatota archaeon]
MRLKKFSTIIFISAIVFSTFFVNKPINAESTINNLIYATFNIELLSATNFTVNVEIIVNKITLSGNEGTYTGSEIETISKTDQLILGAIAYELQILTKNTLTQSFAKNNVKSLKAIPTYEKGKFFNGFSVDLTPSYFNMHESIDIYSIVNGVLDMSAFVNYSFNLKAEPGWNNKYVFNLGNTFTFVRTTGSVSGTKIGWDVWNSDGTNPFVNAEIQLKKINTTTSKLNSEDIFLEFILNCKNPETTVLISNVLLRSIDIRPYQVKPDFISNLYFMPADGVRLFIDNNLLSWDLIYDKTVKSIQQKIKSTIEESSFNQSLDLIFIWDNKTTIDCVEPYNVQKMDDKPNIKAILTDNSVNLKFFNISSRALFGLINSGAEANVSKEDINFGENLNTISYNHNVTIFLPNNIFLDNKNIYTWDYNNTISGKFKSSNATSYQHEDKNTVIEIDIKSSDLNLLSLIGAKTELTFSLNINAEKEYFVTILPKEFTLPKKMSLKYLNSDAFRLCVEEKVFNESSVNNFLENEKNNFETLFKGVLPGIEVNSVIKKDVFEKSLAWDKDISKMEEKNPIITSIYGYCSYPISFNFSVILPSFDIPIKIFNFTGLQDENITYKIIFPNGVSVDVADPLNKTQKKQLSNGRQYIEISFSGLETNTTYEVLCKMNPSLLFIIGILTPCIVGLIITIVLIVLIFIVRKKRGFKRKTPKVRKEEVTGYEDEEYYVPPPPNSR